MKPNLKHTFPSPFPSFWAQIHSRFSPSSPQAAQGRGEWGLRSVHHTLSLPLLPLHTLSLLQPEVPLMGDSSPQTSPA